jgi:hypothetical protein
VLVSGDGGEKKPDSHLQGQSGCFDETRGFPNLFCSRCGIYIDVNKIDLYKTIGRISSLVNQTFLSTMTNPYSSASATVQQGPFSRNCEKSEPFTKLRLSFKIKACEKFYHRHMIDIPRIKF